MRALVFLFLCAALVSCGTPAVTVTINGYDAASGVTLDPINLWQTYAPRGPKVGQVRHGERVTLLREMDGGALIRTSQGVQGWLSVQFIRR